MKKIIALSISIILVLMTALPASALSRLPADELAVINFRNYYEYKTDGKKVKNISVNYIPASETSDCYLIKFTSEDAEENEYYNTFGKGNSYYESSAVTNLLYPSGYAVCKGSNMYTGYVLEQKDNKIYSEFRNGGEWTDNDFMSLPIACANYPDLADALVEMEENIGIVPEEETPSEETKALKEQFGKYLDELGNYHYDNNAEEWFHCEKLSDFGDIKLILGYSYYEYELVYYDDIGNWYFYSPREHLPYELGLYVMRDNTFYPLNKAYKTGVIDDELLDKICEYLIDSGYCEKEHLEIYKFPEIPPMTPTADHEKVVLTDDEALNHYLYLNQHAHNPIARQIGNAGNYALVLVNNKGGDYPETKTIGNYIIKKTKGFYYLLVCDRKEAYNYATAVKEGIVTMKEIYEGFDNDKYSFAFNIDKFEYAVDTPGFLNTLNNFFRRSGADISVTADNVQKYVNIYSDEDGKVVFSVADEYEFLRKEIIDGYYFPSYASPQKNSRLNNRVYTEEKIYTLNSAISLGLYTAEELAQIIPDARKVLPIDTSKKPEKVTLDDAEAYALVRNDYHLTPDKATVTQIGNAGNYAILLVQSDITYGLVKNPDNIFEQDGYRMTESKENRFLCDLKITDYEHVYTLRNAVENGIVTMDEVYAGYDNEKYAHICTIEKLPEPQAVLSAKMVSLKAGKAKKITVLNGTVNNWKSSDKTVATVKNGKVTALRKGNATITATLTNGEKLTAKVKVTSNPKLNKTTKKLKVKGKFTLKVNGKAGTTKFKSNKPKIAAVTKNGVVKAKKKGTAKITVTTNGGVKLKCTVTVK